ncbi:MAG: LPD38 domain-containing protein [Reyranella sp.]|uniref:LPD38 domain-containing protein n=1 Tax=Reyranella sp. TaxID=1929291 RepID=UPI003D0CB396
MLGYEQRDALKAAGYSATEILLWEEERRRALTEGGFSDEEIGRFFGDPQPADGSAVAGFVQGNMDSMTPEQRVALGQGKISPFWAGFNGGLTGYALTGGRSDAMMPSNPSWWDTAKMVFGQFLSDAPVAVPAAVVGAIASAPGGPVAMVAGGAAAQGAATGATRQILREFIGPDSPADPQDALSIAGRIATGTAIETMTSTAGGIAGGFAGQAVTRVVGGRIAGELANIATFTGTSTMVGAGLHGQLPTRDDFVAAAVMALGAGAGSMAARGWTYTREGMQVRSNLEDIYVRTGLSPQEAVQRAAADPVLKQEILAPATEDGTLVTPGLDAIRVPDPPRATDPRTVTEVNPQPNKPTVTIDGQEYHYADGRLTTEPPPPAADGTPTPTVRPSLEQMAEALPPEIVASVRALDEAVTGRPDFDISAEVALPYKFDPGLPAANQARTLLANGLRVFGNTRDALVSYRLGDDFARGWINSGRKFERLPLPVQKYMQTAEALGVIENQGYNAAQANRVLELMGDRSASDMPPSNKAILEGEILPPEGAGGGKGGGTPPGGPEIIPPDPSQPRSLPPGFQLTEDMLAAKVLDTVAPAARQRLPEWLTNPRLIFASFEGQLRPARSLDAALGLSKSRALNVEDMYRQTYASKDRAAYTVRHGAIRWDAAAERVVQTSNDSWIAGYKAVKEDGGNIEGFLAWRLAARHQEKLAQGIDIAPGLEAMDTARLVELGRSKYERGEAILQRNKAADIDYARDAEVFSADRAEAIKDLNRHHINFWRVADPDYVPPQPVGSGGGFRTRQPVKRIKGSDQQIQNPLQTEFANKTIILAMADRNRAHLSLLEKLTRAVAGDRLRLSTPQKAGQRMIESGILEGELLDADGTPIVRQVRNVSYDDIIREAGVIRDENGIPLGKEALEALAPLLAERVFSRNMRDNQFLVFRDGKPEIWEAIDADVAQIIRNFIPGETNYIADLMAKFATGARLGVIGDPIFALRTTTYGQLSIVAAPHASFPFHDMILGVIDRFQGGRALREWERNGGAGAAMADIEHKYVENQISRMWDETGYGANVPNVLTRFVMDKGSKRTVDMHPFEAAYRLLHSLDALARTGYHVRAQKAGLSPLKAAAETRRVYLDYAERPQAQWVHTWTRIVPFMGAGMKGLGAALRGMRERPVAWALKISAAFVIPTVLNYAINKAADAALPDHEKYDNLPQWMRDLYWVSPPINGVRFKIRKPWELGAIATVTERAMQAIFSDQSFMEGLDDSLKSQLVPPWQPTMVTPFFEHATNFNHVSGRSLVPVSMEELSGYMQYYPNTTETAKELARWLGSPNMNIADVSPLVVENYIKAWSGALPLALLRMFNPGEGKPPKEFADVPLVGMFFVRNPGAGQELDQFYQGVQRLQTAAADFRMALQRQNVQEIKDAARQEAFIRLTSIQSAIRNNQDLIERIYATANMTDDEKRLWADALNQRIFVAARYGNAVLGALD